MTTLEELLEENNGDIIEVRNQLNRLYDELESYVYDSGDFTEEQIKTYKRFF